jgi:hypothetical protein
MEGIFMKYGTEIFFGLVSAGALAFCKYLHKKMKEYQMIIEEREQDETEQIVDTHLEPVINDIEELRRYIMNIDTEENRKMGLIISSYRFRLIQLCKIYLRQQYMTQDQYDQLTEFYKLYTGLGGNG